LPKSILIDAGPIIALFDKSDKYHNDILKWIQTYKGYLYTTWPVLTEVCHMLSFNTQVQIDFLEWVDRGGIRLYQIDFEMLKRIIQLTIKYVDVPMDLADATLIVAAEGLKITEIITIDSDFYAYRTIRNKALKNIFLNP